MSMYEVFVTSYISYIEEKIKLNVLSVRLKIIM